MKTAAILALAALGGCSAKPAGPPDFSGVWLPEQSAVRPEGGGAIPLLRAAAATFAANRKAAASGDFGFDHWMKCALHGMQRIMAVPSRFRILQTARKLYTVHEVNHSYRVIPFATKHGTPEPSYMGDAIARVDGDRLHIETTRLAEGLLTRDGVPHSDALKLTEDYRLSSDGQTIAGTITVEDPESFSKTWSYPVTFRRQLDDELKESICVDMTDAQKRALR